MKLSRREAIAGLGGGLAAGCATKPAADDSAAPEVGTIDTIIIVMMENRSFDHMFGSMSLLEGRAIDGLVSGMSNPDRDGVAQPIAHADVQCLPDPHHGWSSSHDQFNGGANDGFVRDYGDAEVMHYMTRDDLPVSYALADAYAVCDRYFCSVMGPTWPNRFYGHAGSSGGMQGNDWPTEGAFTLPTVWNHLWDAGVPWRYYYTDIPFIGLFADHYTSDTVGYLEDFIGDAENGRLPPVVWLDPGFTFNDDHPPHFVGLGQEFIAAVYKAISSGPHWKRCLVLLTYDEHGGFFDHVPPPTTEDDDAATGFDQLGFRVPVIAFGPWVKAGVCSTQFDHASWIKLVCDTYDIEPWTKRIAAAVSLGEILDADRMAKNDPLPVIELPAYDYDDDTLPDACFGGGLGPPAPNGGGGAAPQSTEVWHDLMRRMYPNEDRSQRAKQTSRWIRRYLAT